MNLECQKEGLCLSQLGEKEGELCLVLFIVEIFYQHFVEVESGTNQSLS
jgi:hypothetical protein